MFALFQANIYPLQHRLVSYHLLKSYLTYALLILNTQIYLKYAARSDLEHNLHIEYAKIILNIHI